MESGDDGLIRLLQGRHDNNTIVVAVVNKFFQDFMYNWLCSLRSLNIDRFILYTPDKTFAERLRDEGYWVNLTSC
jgi:c-di-AMP phosphodiesterase-like protein